MITARTVLGGAAENLSHLGLVYLLGGLAAFIDEYPRHVFLRDDLLAELADLAADAQIHDHHQPPGGW